MSSAVDSRRLIKYAAAKDFTDFPKGVRGTQLLLWFKKKIRFSSIFQIKILKSVIVLLIIIYIFYVFVTYMLFSI